MSLRTITVPCLRAGPTSWYRLTPDTVVIALERFGRERIVRLAAEPARVLKGSSGRVGLTPWAWPEGGKWRSAVPWTPERPWEPIRTHYIDHGNVFADASNRVSDCTRPLQQTHLVRSTCLPHPA